jgi:dolichol-phosphate mannosyltransferase
MILPAASLDLSVVAPVFNDEECLDELHRRLTAVLASLTSSYEIVLVDDGSKDGSWRTIEELSRTDPRVRGVRLSRNFGQHFAITAGLEVTRGHRVVVMDSDLQERPEEIPKLWQKVDEGYEVVFSRRTKRRDSFLKRMTSVLFFVVMNRMTGQKVDGEEGTLSILDRRVVDAFLRVTDAHRHYLYILRYLGFRQAFVDVEHAERFAGTTSYGLKRMFIHALDGITSQSTRLLQASSAIGFLCALAHLQTRDSRSGRRGLGKRHGFGVVHRRHGALLARCAWSLRRQNVRADQESAALHRGRAHFHR